MRLGVAVEERGVGGLASNTATAMAWRTTAPITPPSMNRPESSAASSVMRRRVGRVEHEADVGHAGGVHNGKHFRHRAVRDVLVGLKIDAFALSTRGRSLEGGPKLIHRHDTLVESNDAISIDRHDKS